MLLHLDEYHNLRGVENLKLHCCTDGLPLTKSINKGIEPFTVVIYDGHSKPTSAAEYLKDFRDELIEMQHEGIEHHATGNVLQKGSMKPVCFKEFNFNESFCNQDQKEHHRDHSPFEDIPGNDMVRHFPYDYMHHACFSVMQKILLLFMTAPLLVRFQSSVITQLCKKLEPIGVYTPMEFACKLRTIRELRRKIVSHDVFLHFLTFNFAMRCFVSEKFEMCEMKIVKLTQCSLEINAHFAENF
ncbi:hypothetical protein J437_LFUL013680 [Ladona fulva]|uniref:Uncharacterized protein n=1 Tax=Ladona fulva TaxID=123851 RepID=A0A8K0KDA1_LADFU|nr:hypothetical protein J437_LFUL013680 [Ladona fulva]